MTPDGLKAMLYESATRRFVDDDIAKGLSDVPMIEYKGSAVSVDGYTKAYTEYLGDGDREIDAATFASTKTEAKEYVRKAVAEFLGGKR